MEAVTLICGYCRLPAVEVDGMRGYVHGDGVSSLSLASPFHTPGMAVRAADLTDTACDHVWVAGMVYAAPEDLDTVSAIRLVECERCEETRGFNRG